MLQHASAHKGRGGYQADVECPYCRSVAKFYLRGGDVNRQVTQEQWNLFQCTRCGLFFNPEPPTNLSAFYTNDYHPAINASGELRDPLNLYEYRAKLVKRYKESGSLMDVGASSGIFAGHAKRLGFDVSAIEMDPASVKILNDHVGVRGIQSANPAEVLAQEGRKYDVITLWHSIEHMPNPWAVLDACVAHLAHDGILVVASPNPLALQARMMQANWPHFDLPRHLHLFTVGWMRSYALNRNLKIELLTTRDRTSYFLGVGSWRAITTRSVASRLAKLPAGLLGLAVGAIASLFESREGYGAAYTAVFRRV